MPKLTESCVHRLPLAKSKTLKHCDNEIRGFVVFVGKRSKTWYYQKNVGGQTKRALIGRFPVVSAQAARRTALGFALEWGLGAGRKIQIGAPTLEVAMEAYLARPNLRSEAYIHGTRLQIHDKLKDWLKLPLDEISKSMVALRRRELIATPSTANKTLRRFRSIWNHARRTLDLPECPTMAIEWFREEPDGRVIEDLVKWRAEVCALHNPIHKVFYQLALFTGFRKTELLTLEWKNVHEDRVHLPMTRNGRSFDLPITRIHHEILAPLRNLSRQWVFPSPKSMDGYVTNPQKISWSPHAHRRTFATVAVEAGVLEEIVGRLLNHTPLSITGQRYARPSLDALRPAMQLACDELQRRIGAATDLNEPEA